jgi:hypothetical protein
MFRSVPIYSVSYAVDFRRLPKKMEIFFNQSVDNEHSRFDNEKDTSVVIQIVRIYVWFFFLN